MSKSPVLNKMSKAEARVLIAKDVIAQIKAKRFIATECTYIGPNLRANVDFLFTEKDFQQGKDVRDVFWKRAKSCDVCAKGAIFLATVDRFDKCKIEEDMISCFGSSRLGDLAQSDGSNEFFSPKQMRLIEQAFEGWSLSASDGVLGDRVGDAIDAISDTYFDEKSRLIYIMENIISNKGTFKPTQILKD